MVLLRQRLSLRSEGAAVELLGSDRQTGLDVALRRVLVVTGVSEGIGAALLTILFRVHGDTWLAACWRGLFTSISAYCNAGFALQTTSLIPYQHSPLVLHVIAALIIVGGLGPVVVVSVPDLLRRRPLKLHVRIVLIMTGVLLFAPAVLIGALEWQHSLADLGVADRLHNAWFQSVTTRTAGFNSVDFAAMTPATLTLVEALMFIGGSPASTAGGVKTTTVFVLVMAVDSVARLRTKVEWGGWTIPHATVYRAAAVVTLGALSVVFGVFAIQLTQGMDTQMAIFEVVSALGTVGLSIGGTAQLDSVGKLIIIVCMFLGRIAPLSLFLMFSRQSASVGTWSFPEQDVSVG
jgi:trk system potassium uptake protein TrkH